MMRPIVSSLLLLILLFLDKFVQNKKHLLVGKICLVLVVMVINLTYFF